MSLSLKFLIAPFALLALTMSACTQDEEPVDEVVTPETADTPGSAEDLGSLDGAGDLSANNIYFAFDDYTLNMDAKSELDRLAEQMRTSPGAVVQIEGHCDERGSIEYNLALGERRANSVKNYLASLGVEGARLSTISYGEEKPAVDGHDESAWSQNRRAEFVVSNPQ